MTLDPGYLHYPKRHLGYDHQLYPWSCLFDRPAVHWPDRKAVAIWFVVSLEWFPLTPSDKPFRAPGHMQLPFPDMRNYTGREYGTRVGFYRLLDAFAAQDIPISVAVNSAIAERYPQVISDIVTAGHEIIAHSTDMNGTIASGLPAREERELITRSLDTLERISGVRPRGWHSIARSQSWDTSKFLAEAGLDYMCDWVNDEMPYRFAPEAGGIVNLPLNHELSDRQILSIQQQPVESYARQIEDAYDWLEAEAVHGGGRLLPLNLTPYIMGLPYRMAAFETLLATLKAKPSAWVARGDSILDAWVAEQPA